MKEQCLKELERISSIKRNDTIKRYGTLFSTDFNNYFYDTGTQKILTLDTDEFEMLTLILADDIDSEEFKKRMSSFENKKIESFLETCIKEHLLRATVVKNMYSWCDFNSYSELLNTSIQQLVLEVTEKCNFRCKYCIYNEEYIGDRNFENIEMDISTAKRAIEFLFERGAETVAVTFYGGEPLINFPVIKESVQYALKLALKYNKKVNFNMTSNMTLMTYDIAKFIADTPDFFVLVSLDGPENIHNNARVYRNGKGTFADTMKGLKILNDAFEKVGRDLSINAVLVPPYDYDKLEEINYFFENIDFLSSKTDIRITYPSFNTYNYDKWWQIENNPTFKMKDVIDPLLKFQLKLAKRNPLNINERKNIYFKAIFDILYDVDCRLVTDIPEDSKSCNGCCVPGVRKIYVKANGDMIVCEKIGISPIIGNVWTGFKAKETYEVYVKDYIEKSLQDCSKCWAIKLCKICYSDCFENNVVDIEKKRFYCKDMRKVILRNLETYFEIRENYPQYLEILK